MRQSLFTAIRERIRYYRHSVSLSGLGPQLLLDILAKGGILIQPYHVVAEGLEQVTARPSVETFAEYEVSFFGPAEMPVIAALPGRTLSLQDLLSRLQVGKLCLGVKHQGVVVAFTWCSLTEGTIGSYRLFSLQEHEAYLFDAYTMEQFRGVGIAPYLRYRCYEELAKLGRPHCYSITAVWNAPAARFKRKLGARIVELGVLVSLLRRWRFHLRLRDYRKRYEAPSGVSASQ